MGGGGAPCLDLKPTPEDPISQAKRRQMACHMEGRLGVLMAHLATVAMAATTLHRKGMAIHPLEAIQLAIRPRTIHQDMGAMAMMEKEPHLHHLGKVHPTMVLDFMTCMVVATRLQAMVEVTVALMARATSGATFGTSGMEGAATTARAGGSGVEILTEGMEEGMTEKTIEGGTMTEVVEEKERVDLKVLVRSSVLMIREDLALLFLVGFVMAFTHLLFLDGKTIESGQVVSG